MNSFLYKITIGLFTCLALPFAVQAQLFGEPVKGDFLIQSAELYTVTNGILEADLLIRDGKIAAIGEDIDPGDAEVINAAGKRVYPGFIDAGTRLGLSEISSVSMTTDFNEQGNLTPYAQALTAINPNSIPIPVTRLGGVTTVLSAPSGGILPGTAAAIHLFGYTPDQMYAGKKAVILVFPTSARTSRWDRRSAERRQEDYENRMKKLNDFWEEAERYYEIREKGQNEHKKLASYEALLPVFRGEKQLFVEVNRAADILKALEWLEKKELDVVLTGVAEGWRVTDEIGETGYPVIAGPVLQTPSRSYDRYDRPYANPSAMHEAGIQVAIRTNEMENVRNLPFNAGFAASYGLGVERALEAITIVPAQILGLDDQIGSLEVGKLANLFIADGDPFEPRTQIERVFIRGWDIPMESRHTQLYDQFIDRVPGAQLED
ncbi:MAG: amidohydrolase [Saprospirales bacterium]|nr:MAG: amidohydrolase [Saprospirales bacterium]